MDFFATAVIQGLGFSALALGIFISLKIFNIPDITTDGSYTLGGAVTAVMLVSGYSPMTTLPVALLAGMAAGIATGMIHTTLKVHPLLSGILVMTALYSVNLGIMGRSNLPLINTDNLFTSLELASNPFTNQLLIMTVVILIVALFLGWLLHTDFGIAMRATGNSEQMVRAAGMNTQAMKIAGLAMSNALTALSGFLLVQSQGFADINMGIGIVISGLAAVMIGDAFLKFSRGNSILIQVFFVVGGSLLFRIVLAFSLSLGLNPNYLKLVTALIVLAVVGIPVIKRSRP